MHNLLVLGCLLDSTGSTEAQIRGRVFQGQKMFNKRRPMLCCPQNLEEKRISAFHTTVGLASCGLCCRTPSVNAPQFVSVQENMWFQCRAGWKEEQRSRVGGKAPRKKNGSFLAVQAGHSGLVAPSDGGDTRLAGHMAETDPHPGRRCSAVE